MSLDERRLLGCVYVDPPTKEGFEAEVSLWARESELASGFEEELYGTVRAWIAREWPFSNVAYPGREIDWETWRGLRERRS